MERTSPTLVRRLRTSGVSITPDEVRRRLDEPDGDAAYAERDRDRAARLLLHVDDPVRVLDLGLRHLVREVGAARGDAGLLDVTDGRYVPAAIVADPDGEALIRSTPLPNDHPVLRAAWACDGPVAFDDVGRDGRLGSLRPVFAELGATAMVARRISVGPIGLGLLCVDEVEGRRRWDHRTVARIDDFVRRWLAPVLLASLLSADRSPLTAAERRAVAELARGHTYAEIARRLGKSERTIDNQLRSARRKLGARNGVELVKAFETASTG
ncbi:MAG: helix-turn-helix transcriptional regulator [Actinomycetota bacterium]